MNGKPTTEEELASLRTDMAGLKIAVQEIKDALRSNSGFPWQLAMLIFAACGGMWTLYSSDQRRFEQQIDVVTRAHRDALEDTHTRLDKLDTNLQREQRDLDARILEKVEGLKELREAESAAVKERVSALESRLTQGFNERWSKADHEADMKGRDSVRDQMVRRIERLEAFHMGERQ